MYKVTKYCRLCLNPKMKIGIKLSKVPLGERYTLDRATALKSKKFPFTLGWCSRCRNIQTMEVIQPKILWKDFTYLSRQQKLMLDHFKYLTKKIINQFSLKKNDFVIDVGSNDGSFLKFFKKKGMKVLGVDPASNVARIAQKDGIRTLINFFNLKIAKKINYKFGKAKIITCFNTFAHSENMREIIKGVKNLMNDDSVFIFECQYLNDIYNKKILGTLFHEHMYHHSVTSLNNFFNSFGLKLFHVSRVNIQKGSIIGFVSRDNKVRISKSVKKLLQSEKINRDIEFSKLIKFKKFINLQKKRCGKILRNYKNLKIAAYGAARSGPTLASNFGVDKYLSILFDDHHLKINKYTPLNGLRVRPTKDMLIINPAVCVVLAYLHLGRIIKKSQKYLDKGGKFLALYPKATLISKKNYKRFI